MSRKYLSMCSKTEPSETGTSLDQREKSSCCSLDSQAPAKVKILSCKLASIICLCCQKKNLQLSTSREGGNPLSSEARTSPEIEALELKLAAGEDQANLGTVMKKVGVWKILQQN